MSISLITLLVSKVFSQATVHAPYMRNAIDQQKAEMLAFSGLSIATSQLLLADAPDEQEQKDDQKEKQQISPEVRFLKHVLSVLNRWQQFTLNEKQDGVNGQIALCIGCEDGKLDINAVYDFKQKKFVGEGSPQGDYKKGLQELFGLIEKFTGGKGMFEALEKFFKERSYPLNDATELLVLDEFSYFKRAAFYEPTELVKDQQPRLCLTDLFTVFTAKPKVEPWLFSDAYYTLFALNRPTVKEEQEALESLLKGFKQTSNWPQEWNTLLKPRYGKDFATLPKSAGFFLSSKFEPKIFSVLSYGKIGQVTQKILAVFEKERATEKHPFPTMTIKKIYRL